MSSSADVEAQDAAFARRIAGEELAAQRSANAAHAQREAARASERAWDAYYRNRYSDYPQTTYYYGAWARPVYRPLLYREPYEDICCFWWCMFCTFFWIAALIVMLIVLSYYFPPN